MEKKIDKEILSIFNLDTYSKKVVIIDEEVNNTLPLKFNNGNFYEVSGEENLIGYFYYGNAPSKADVFDYVVIFDKELIIKKIKILAYREDYGGEIGSKRWLKQFNDLSFKDNAIFNKNIRGISGATISARSMTVTVNQLLESFAIIQKNNTL
jgi:Na+-translocating ferredoxin:NAD+ oxidoreductase RnfG subunit